MTTLIRLSCSSALQKHTWNKYLQCHSISTSKKNTTTKCPQTPSKIKCEEPPKEYWVSYGFDYQDQKEDTNNHHASFFFSVTLCLVFGSFVWAYAPDIHMRDWAQREAFLELRRREKGGHPPISPHFIEPDKIKLPEEDDLCEVDILI